MVIFTKNIKKVKMKNVLLFIGVFLFVSCSEEEKSPTTDTKKEVVELDTISHKDTLSVELPIAEDSVSVTDNYSFLVQSPMFFLPEEVLVLQQYFSDSSIVVYDSCQALLADALTDLEFGKAYLKLLEIRNSLTSQIYNGDFGGTADGWHNWFERTWDYGGGSLFGSGIHMEILETINKLKLKTSMYNELISKYQAYLLMDIQHGIYMKSQEEATAELKNILSLEYLSSDEKQPLQFLLGNWEKGDAVCKNCVDGIYQFDCATGDCNWGG